jgi:hypothetical protein
VQEEKPSIFEVVISLTLSMVVLVANIVESCADNAVVDVLIGLMYAVSRFWLFYW